MKKQLYEGMYVLNSTLSEDAMKKGIERITSAIEEHGGEIHKVHDQGRRKLAYEICGHRQGNYYVIYFTAPTTLLKAVDRDFRLNEDLIRFVNMTAEKVVEKIEFKPLVEAQ